MRFSNRIFLYGPFGLLMLLAAGVMTYWWFAAGAVSVWLDSSNGRAIAPGVTLRFANKQIAGFPFRVDAILDNVEIDVATSQGPASWQAEHFALHALTYGPKQALYEAAGKQTLRWTGLDGARHVWVFTPTILRASSYNEGPQLARFDLDAIAIRSPELNADRFQFHLRHNTQHDGLDIVITGQGIHLSRLLQAGFGDTIAKLDLDAAIAPATPLAPLLAGRGDWRAALEDWRTHSGAFTLNALEVDWNTLKATASGQLSLDDQHRPHGLLRVNLDGVQSLAAELSKLGIAQGDNNGLAPALAAAALAGNAQIQLSANVGFKDGILYVGDAPAGFLRSLY
jgi:hypothetical protein